MRLEPEDALIKLRGNKLHILCALSMLPILCVRPGMYAGKTCLSVKDIRMLTNISIRTINDELPILHGWGLAVRVHRYGWRLSDGIQQLPLPIFLPAGDRQIADPSVDYLSPPPIQIARSVENNAGSAKFADPKMSGSAKFADPDTIMINDDDDEIKYTDTVLLLDQLGIGGTAYELMATQPLETVLAGWWYSKTWAKTLPGGFIKHMTNVLTGTRDRKNRPYRTPREYIDLARWWLANDNEAREQLIDYCTGLGAEPIGISNFGLKAAKTVYATDSGFDFIPARD